MYYYPDTNVFIDGIDLSSYDQIVIGSVVLEELDKLKRSSDLSLAFRARKALSLIASSIDDFLVLPWNQKYDDYSSRDTAIIYEISTSGYPITLLTSDLGLTVKAKSFNIPFEVVRTSVRKHEETVHELTVSEEVFETFIRNNLSVSFIEDFLGLKLKKNTYVCFTEPEFLMLKYDGSGFTEVPDIVFNSQLFGRVKPKDIYQLAAMDALRSSDIVMLKGPAGSGKSLLTFAYAMSEIKKNNYSSLTIFCNPIPVKNTREVGYLPGDLTHKLMDSYIGNILTSKVGDKDAVMSMIANNIIILQPLHSIRGFDTSSMNTIVWITEAQNLSVDLLKIAGERVGGDHPKLILDGDPTAQIDIRESIGRNNGMDRMSEVFIGLDFYSEVTLKNKYRTPWSKYFDLL